MSDYKRISKQVGFSYVIQGVSFLVKLFLFMTLTRLLSKSDYGIYTILTATLFMLNRILLLGLPSFIARDIPGKSVKDKKKGISVLLNLITIIISSFIILGLIIKKPLLEYLKFDNYSSLFQIILFLIGFSVLIKVICSYFIANKKIIESKLLYFSAVEFWEVIIIFYGLYKQILTLKQIFSLQIIVMVIIFVIILFHLIKKHIWTTSFDRSYIKKAFAFSLPLMLVAAISWIITASDRYILGFFHGSAMVAIYSYSYSLFSFVLTAGMIISSTLFPYIAEAWNRNKKDKANFLFNASIKYTIVLVLPAVFGILLMREEIFTLISGNKYLAALPILPILMFFPLLHLFDLICQQSLMLKNRTKTIGVIYAIGLITNIILNFALIPRFHFYGASIATILTYILMFSLFYWQSRKIITLDNKYIKIERILLSTGIMSIALFFLHPTNVFTKLLVISLSALLYFIVLYSLKGFVKEEINFAKSLFKGKLPFRKSMGFE